MLIEIKDRDNIIKIQCHFGFICLFSLGMWLYEVGSCWSGLQIALYWTKQL